MSSGISTGGVIKQDVPVIPGTGGGGGGGVGGGHNPGTASSGDHVDHNGSGIRTPSISNWLISKDGTVGGQTGAALFGADKWSKMTGTNYSKFNSNGASSAPKMPVFGAGSRGDNVRAIQQRLNQMNSGKQGWSPLKEDGIFGGLTRQAVTNFQSSYNSTSNRRAGNHSDIGGNYISETPRTASRGQAVSPFAGFGHGQFVSANPSGPVGNNNYWGPQTTRPATRPAINSNGGVGNVPYGPKVTMRTPDNGGGRGH